MNNHYEQEEAHRQRYASSPGRNRVGKIYKQFYRKAWEEIPEFKEWLTSIPGERSKAYCKICEKSLHAHRLSLTKHTVSLKHMRMAQKRIQETSEIYNEECYEEEGGEMDEGEVRYQMSDSGQVVRVIKGELDDSQHDQDLAIGGEVGREEITVTEEEEEHPRLVYHHRDDSGAATSNITMSQEETIPSDGVSLIKIIPKQKMSSHERVNVITQHLSPNNREMNEKPHITTHVLDISKGLPVAGLPVSLYQLIEGRWILLKESSTNGDGRCNKLTGCNGIKPGRYKLHFDTERYFLLRHQPTFYPFVEVVFDVCSPSDHNHVPLLLGPYGYTTYRGS